MSLAAPPRLALCTIPRASADSAKPRPSAYRVAKDRRADEAEFLALGPESFAARMLDRLMGVERRAATANARRVAGLPRDLDEIAAYKLEYRRLGRSFDKADAAQAGAMGSLVDREMGPDWRADILERPRIYPHPHWTRLSLLAAWIVRAEPRDA